MRPFLVSLPSACRFLPARLMWSSHRRNTACAPANSPMSLAEYWKDLRPRPDLTRATLWRFFSAREFLAIIKSVAPSISTRSAASAWTRGKNVGMTRCEATPAPPALKNECAISAGGFTRHCNRTGDGHNRTVIRSSSSDRGREAKDHGVSSAIACSMRTAITFTWRSS